MQKIETYCKICGSKKESVSAHLRSDTYGGEVTYRLLRCNSCGLRYIQPQPPWEAIKKLYSGKLYYEEAGTDGFNEDGSLKFPPHKLDLCGLILDEIEPYIRARKPRVLDVGCGWGHFLKIVKDKGWYAEGLEMSKISADYVRERLGINVFNGTLKEALFKDEDFDLVHMADVLEHMAEPFKALDEARRILRPGGIIVLKTPNADSLLNRLDFLYLKYVFYAKPKSHLFLQHLYHFTAPALKKGVENCRFEYLKTIFFQEPFRTKAKGILRDMVINTIAKASVMPSHKTSIIVLARK